MTYKLRVGQIPREYCSLFLLISSQCLYIHACFFFFYLSFSLSFVNLTLLSLSFFILFIYICIHTSLFSYSQWHTHARAHIQPTKIHTRHMYIFLIMHASARTHTTYIHTLSCSFFRWIGA